MNRKIKFKAWDMESKKFVQDEFLMSSVKKEVITVVGVSIDTENECSNEDVILLQYTGLKDKNGKEIYEGDIVEGHMGWLKGDGYKQKKYPERIRVWLQVVFSCGRDGDVGIHLLPINVHPQDKEASEKYFYRSVEYNLREDMEPFLKDNEHVWLGKNDSLEIIGNTYEHPELLTNSTLTAK